MTKMRAVRVRASAATTSCWSVAARYALAVSPVAVTKRWIRTDGMPNAERGGDSVAHAAAATPSATTATAASRVTRRRFAGAVSPLEPAVRVTVGATVPLLASSAAQN